jgi:hypothetical protein
MDSIMKNKVERFVSKLQMHIIDRMSKGENMYEVIESDKSTFIVGDGKRATRIKKTLVDEMINNILIKIDNRQTYKKNNVIYLGFKSKNKRKMKLTSIGKQIAKDFSL